MAKQYVYFVSAAAPADGGGLKIIQCTVSWPRRIETYDHVMDVQAVVRRDARDNTLTVLATSPLRIRDQWMTLRRWRMVQVDGPARLIDRDAHSRLLAAAKVD